MMRICPKCGDYYADALLAFCIADGTPLINVDPKSEVWSEGTRVIEEKENALKKQRRKLKWRRVLMSATTMLVVTLVVCVVAINSYIYLKPKQEVGAVPKGTPSADLSLIETVDNSTPNVGGQVVFTLELSNKGPSAARGSSVKVQLPPGLTYASDDSGGAYNNATGIWTVDTLDASSKATLHLTATATDASTGGVTSTAEVFSSNEFDPNSTPSNNVSGEDDQSSLTLNALDADLSITLTSSTGPVAPGGELAYTITVTNNGPETAQSVKVTDNLPPSVAFIKCTVNKDGICGREGNRRIVSFASLAKGVTATITLQTTVSNSLTKGATVENTASVRSATFDPAPDNNSETETITLQEPPTLCSDADLSKIVCQIIEDDCRKSIPEVRGPAGVEKPEVILDPMEITFSKTCAASVVTARGSCRGIANINGMRRDLIVPIKKKFDCEKIQGKWLCR